MQNIIQMISENLNLLIHKFFVVFGWSGLGVGATLGIVNGTASKVMNESSAPWVLADYAALVSLVAALTVILKNLVDVWLAWERRRNGKEGDK